MNVNNLVATEVAAVVGVVDPDAYSANSYSTGWVAAKNFDQFMAIVQAGDLGSSATLDAKIEQALDSGGTSPKDVSGAAITQLTQAGTDSNKQSVINVKSAALDKANGYDYLRLTVTVAVATSDVGAVLLGFGPRFGPASDFDAATVDEIVNDVK